MGGTPGDYEVKHADLMTPSQELMLALALGATGNAMQGFQFGAPYMGPKLSSYTPKEFKWDYFNPNVKGGPPEKPEDDDDKREYVYDLIVKQGGSPGATKMPQSGLPGVNMFNNLMPQSRLSSPQGPANTPSSTSLLAQLLTNPYVSPFRQGMTGNSPTGG